jgi:phage-related minor tail protein
MADHESTMKWKVDIGDLTKAMQEAKRSIKVANAEFKTATAGMDRWSKSTDGLEAKLKQLNTTLPKQKQILDDLERQYKITAENMGENSKEAQDLRLKIEEQRATIVKTETNIGKYNDQLNKMQQEQLQSETATGKLNQTIEEQQDQLDGLKDAYADAVLQYGKNSKEAKELAHQIEDLSGELADNKKRLKDADTAADQFDKTLEDTDDSAGDLTEGFSVMKGALADLVASGIKAAIQGLKDLAQAAVDAYKEFDEGEDNVIKATGATGEAAEKLAASYKKVTKSVVGDMGTIGSALGEVNTRFGFTGQKLEDATVQFMKFSDITGTDAVTAVQLVSRAMGDAGIDADDYAQVLDELAIAAQASGISVDKLTENLTKYGAPMRALGFDTKEAIAIFSQWEKAGVNTEIAFSGMKNAISKWSAEGKDAKEEFKKVLDEIAATPDIASATTKAIEIFGKKAGPDLADAIKGGRFEYSAFLDLLEGSEGTVTNTYEETQDGFDKINLAIQGARAELGSYVGAMAKKYQPQIESFIKQAVKGLKQLLDKGMEAVKWLNKNGETVMTVLKGIATAFITYKAVSTITSVFGAFKTLFTAIKGGQSIMAAFNATMAMNPYALIAAGIAGLAVVIGNYALKQQEATAAEYKLNEAQQETIDKVAEMTETYNQLDQARNESVAQINAEYGHIDALKEEYNSLIDSNGKVKKGYEDRANFIINQLAQSLGVEKEKIQELIDENGKLGESIDQIIEKKKAEAILSANEQMYTEAIQNRSKAFDELSAAQKTVDEAEQKYHETSQQSQEFMRKYNELLKESPEAAQAYWTANSSIIDANNTAKASYEEANKKVNEAEDAWIGYNSTIQNYEGLSAAIISGDSEKINEAMANMTANFITAETGNRESLERQVKNYETNLKNLEDAIKRGTPNVTQEQVEQARSMVDAANAELDKLPPEASATGQQAGSNFASGVGSKAGAASAAGASVGSSANKGAGDGSKGMKGTGEKAGGDYAKGVESKEGSAKTAGKDLAGEAKKGAEDVSAEGSGKNFGEGFLSGIGSKLKSAWNKGWELAKNALAGLKAGGGEGSPWKEAIPSGGFFGEGFIVGMNQMVQPVRSAASDLAKEAVDALGSNLNAEMRAIGAEGGNSLIEGMNGVLPNMSGAIGDLKASVASSNANMSGIDVGTFDSAGGSQTQNVVFNQTINSPKALSRLEVYRETQSMLFSAKVRLSNV